MSPLPMPKRRDFPRPLDVRHDVDRDLVTIDGQRFSGAFFRAFALAEGESRYLRISKVDGQIVAQSSIADALRQEALVDELYRTAMSGAAVRTPLVIEGSAGEEITLNGQRLNGESLTDYLRRAGFVEESPGHWRFRTDAAMVNATLATAAGGAHILQDGAPLCLGRKTGAVHCEYASFASAFSVVRALEAEHPAMTFETVSGPCPHCAKQRAASC